MKQIGKFIMVFISFSAGLMLGVNIKTFYEASTFKPYSWSNPPKIANCYGPEFSKLQMARAMDYWAIRGYTLGDYIHKPSDDVCEREWTSGYVVLRKSKGLPSSTLASTRRYTVVTTMQGAVIRYQPGSYNLDLLNEHELGHALGFTHLEVDNHIMHPNYGKMGRSFWIP